jgi:hypothetical protein
LSSAGKVANWPTNKAGVRFIAMTKLHQLPETTLRRYKDGNGWFLEVVDDRGVPENIGDFNSEADAIDWIVHESEAFFKARMR